MRRLARALAALALLLAGARAEAYCRSAACPERDDGTTDGHVCDPPQFDDCGLELQWRQPCIGFNVQRGASSQIDYATAEALLAQAFATWTSVDCGGLGSPSIAVFDLGAVSCGKVEYNQHAGNTNVLVFRDDGWPHDDDGSGTADTLALTTVTYDVEKGDIYDADIEVNTANDTFTTTDTPGELDVNLLSVLTHEAGHLLGLAHSPEAGATMFPDYTRGTTTLRVLSPDDEMAICVAYPPERKPVGECTGIPRHGFAPECNDEQTYVKCAASPADGGSAPGLGALALGAAVTFARRRARRAAIRWSSNRSPVRSSSNE
ncbi:MAG: matrixin family metalloprotease [Minicystis sp.]